MSESEVAAVLSAEPLVGLKQTVRFRRPQSGSLSAEPLVGLKQRYRSAEQTELHSFSRTPRGFEATPSCAVRCCTVRLSAEPLVGLKPPRSYGLVIDHSLSAEPLVGLKQSAVDSGVAP
jgi:hypothetical protein